jgi:hypothetical protein
MCNKFEKWFDNIFGRIVNGGKTDVRYKKISEKVKGILKYKNCLAIKVSFNENGEPTKKWT